MVAIENTVPAPRRWLDALFGEALELGRRRRRRHLAVLLLAAAAAAGGAGFYFGGRGPAASGAARATISSAALPLDGSYWQITAVRGHLVLTGGEGALEQQRVSSIAGGQVPSTCTSATVDPVSLRVLSRASGSCGDPALYGRRVLPVTYVARTHGPMALALRVAAVSRQVKIGYRLGPVVVRYPQCSDCGVQWVYGDGSLWVYAPYSTPNLSGGTGELFRISEQTGRLLQHWRTAVFTRALLAADADGAWIAQSLFGGMPSPMIASQRTEYDALYRVAPGMRTPQRVRQLGGWGADWLVASGHSLWVDEAEGRRLPQLWRLDGAAASVQIRARRVLTSSRCVQMGEQAVTMTGSLAAGIFCQNEPVQPGAPAPALQSFDPATGAAHAIAAPALMGASTALGSSVYFLGSSRSGSHQRIYRISTA